MGRFRQPTAATMSELATTPPVSPQGSTVSCAASFTSSSISRRVSSLKNSVKKSIKNGAQVVVRPFKKARRALSSCTTNDNDSTVDKDGSEDGDDETSDNAVKHLGAPVTQLDSLSLLIGHSETQTYLALLGL
jgi:hypothetical protein